MSEVRLKTSPRVTVIDLNAALVNGTRAAADYDNSVLLNLYCHVYLQVQFDAGPPAVGVKIADLWILPGDGETTQIYPIGGSATVGTNLDPQAAFYVGGFETINPSLTVDEVLGIPAVPLFANGNRFVLKNTSGFAVDSTWELRIKPFRLENA